MKTVDNQAINESPIYSELSIYKVIDDAGTRPFITHTDGSVSAIARISGINTTTYEESHYEALFDRINDLIKSMGHHQVCAQFLAVRKPYKSLRVIRDLPSYLKPRADLFNKKAELGQIFNTEYFISIHVTQLKQESGSSIMDSFDMLLGKDVRAKIYEKQFAGIDERIDLLMNTVDNFITTLTGINGSDMTLKPLETKDEYYGLLQEFTRPLKSEAEKVKIDDKREETRRVLFTGVRARVMRDYFVLDDVLHRVYSLDRPPQDKVFGDSIKVLQSVPYGFIYSVTFKHIPYNETIRTFKTKLLEKRFVATKNENAMVEDKSVDAEARRVDEVYDSFVHGQSVGVRCSVNLVVRVDMSKILEKAVSSQRDLDYVIRNIDNDMLFKVFPSFGRSEWVAEPDTQWVVFSRLIPGMSELKTISLKSMLLSSQDIPYLLHISSQKNIAPHDGVNHFYTIDGGYTTFDIMDPRLPAKNYCISGQTGSGKSNLAMTILAQQYAEAHDKKPPVVCILDAASDMGSYAKLGKLVGGEVVMLGGTKKPSIQMFELDPDDCLPNPTKEEKIAKILNKISKSNEDHEVRIQQIRAFYHKVIQEGRVNVNKIQFLRFFKDSFGFNGKFEMFDEIFLLSPGECLPNNRDLARIMAIIEVMISDNAEKRDGFAKFSADDVQETVYGIYLKYADRFPTLSDYVEAVSEVMTEGKGKQFVTKLKQFTKSGPFPYFDSKTEVDLNNDFILVDLKGLDAEPKLKFIYYALFGDLFYRKMYKIKNRRKIMYRDEAWTILKEGQGRKMLIEDMRTSRKAGFANVIITQSPLDFMNPSPQDGKVILGQMQVHIIGKMKASDVNDLVGVMRLDPHMAGQLPDFGLYKTLDGKGAYAKYMMITGDSEYKVLINELHPFEDIMYSSSADDNTIIDYYMNVTGQFKNLEDVLWHITRKRHIGDMELYNYLIDGGSTDAARKVRGGK